ncbi:MAG: acylphosphatase [Candidatus Omnitrophica bacterium]|nr:acylphosphatase [Candidatus Omnitrophota bacterium]
MTVELRRGMIDLKGFFAETVRAKSHMIKQMKVIFKGMVQGVGFRFTVQRLARRFDVKGYVRNLPNGQVEVLAEGEETILEDFLKAIQVQMQHYIQDIEIVWGEACHRYGVFGITS